MVYRFLDLPHHTQVHILRELGLTEGPDDYPDVDEFAACFKRARESGKVEQLREAIGRETAA